jgi:hypothetical protein
MEIENGTSEVELNNSIAFKKINPFFLFSLLIIHNMLLIWKI